MARQAMFSGLVYDEAGNLVNTKLLGDSAQYVIDDDGFFRHIDSEIVDRQVFEHLFRTVGCQSGYGRYPSDVIPRQRRHLHQSRH